MIIEVWLVSVCILAVSEAILSGAIRTSDVVKSLLPTTFANNWYITCYLLFYIAHPWINKIIYSMSKKQLLRATLLLTFIYLFLNTLKGDLFFPSQLIYWLAIYFLVAYEKLYLKSFTKNREKNIALFAISLTLFFGIILLTNVLGLHVSVFSDKVLRWNNNCNIFAVFCSVALFNIARSIKFKNKYINYMSGLSLLIYIIHENIILRTYFRPYVWIEVYKRYGYSHVVEWVFIIAINVFVLGFLLAMIFDALFKRSKTGVGNLYNKFKKIYIRCENTILQTCDKL